MHPNISISNYLFVIFYFVSFSIYSLTADLGTTARGQPWHYSNGFLWRFFQCDTIVSEHMTGEGLTAQSTQHSWRQPSSHSSRSMSPMISTMLYKTSFFYKMLANHTYAFQEEKCMGQSISTPKTDSV